MNGHFLGHGGRRLGADRGGLAAILGGIGSAIGITDRERDGVGHPVRGRQKFGKLLPIAAMPGTQGIYGFIAAVLVLVFFDILGGDVDADRDRRASRSSWPASRSAWLCLVTRHLPGHDRRVGGGHRGAAQARTPARRSSSRRSSRRTRSSSLIVTILMLLGLQAAYM